MNLRTYVKPLNFIHLRPVWMNEHAWKKNGESNIPIRAIVNECVWVLEWKKERESERDDVFVCVCLNCVCVCEQEGKIDSVCVCLFVCVGVCVRVYVCEREREGERAMCFFCVNFCLVTIPKLEPSEVVVEVEMTWWGQFRPKLKGKIMVLLLNHSDPLSSFFLSLRKFPKKKNVDDYSENKTIKHSNIFETLKELL